MLIDIDPVEGGIVEVNGDIPCEYPYTLSVSSGSDVILEALPNDGYHFVKWDGEPTIIETANPAELRVIRNMQVTALFAPDTIEFASENALLNVIIPYTTVALDTEGAPLTDVRFTVNEEPPLPQDASIVGQAYNLEPDGATFDPPATLTWEYEAAYLPDGITEDDLFIAYYDEDASEWVALDSEVEPEEAIVTAPVDHLTVFALLAPKVNLPPATVSFTVSELNISPTEISPDNQVNIGVSVNNTGQVDDSYTVTLKINGAIAETREVSLAGGSSQTVIFTTTPGEVGTYSVDINGLTGSFTVKDSVPPSPPIPPSVAQAPPPQSSTPPAESSGINWPVVAPILCAIFLAIFLPIKLRHRREHFDW